MYKSKLFELLHTLEIHEWKELKRFLLQHTEERSEVFQLFLRIEKHKSNFEHKNLSIDYQHRKYYPKLERKTVLNLLSKLAKQVEHFLTITEIQQDKNIWDLYKVKAYNRRGLHEKANQLGNKMRERLSDPSHLSLWHPWYLIALNHTIYFSYNPIKNTSAGPTLLKHCISSTLKLHQQLLPFYTVAARNRENLQNEDWSNIQSQLDLDDLDKNKILYCLYHLQQLSLYNSIDNYEKLYNAFFDETIKIDQGIAIPIFMKLKEYLTYSAREGNNFMLEKISNLLYQGIKSERSLYYGKVDSNNYISTVISLSISKEWGKVDEILTKGKDIIPVIDYNEVNAIAQMNVLLRKNHTDELVQLYQNTKFINLKYKTIAIPLTIRAFYQDFDQDEEFLKTQIRNYKELLRRNSKFLSDQKFKGQMNFLSILKLMIHQKDLSVIYDHLENIDNIYYRTWIEEQLKKEEQL